jgi:hypothetical protein
MAIKYALYLNQLTPRPNDCVGFVQITASADREKIADRMLEQGSTVTKMDILAVLEGAERAVVSLLLDGFRVQVGGLVDLFPRVIGVFEGSDDKFDRSRHRLDVGANPGVRVRREVRARARPEKVQPGVAGPIVSEFRDLATASMNETMTRGNIGTLRGSRLQFSTEKPDEGIFLKPVEGDGRSVQIPKGNVQKNKPSELVFLVPNGDTLQEGDYVVEVRTRAKGSSQLRSSALERTIVVV